jgi:hypothetical protein
MDEEFLQESFAEKMYVSSDGEDFSGFTYVGNSESFTSFESQSTIPGVQDISEDFSEFTFAGDSEFFSNLDELCYKPTCADIPDLRLQLPTVLPGLGCLPQGILSGEDKNIPHLYPTPSPPPPTPPPPPENIEDKFASLAEGTEVKQSQIFSFLEFFGFFFELFKLFTSLKKKLGKN